MAQTLAPFGFLPVFHTSGAASPRQKFGNIQTTSTSVPHGLYQNQPVLLDSNGNLQPAVTYGSPNVVAPVRAIFAGISYADQNGFFHNSPFIAEGTPIFAGSVSGTNSGYPTNTYVQPYIYQDPEMEFAVQFNGTITQSAIGKTFDIDPTTIDDANISGISGVALDNTPVGSQAGNFIVTELYMRQGIRGGNVWGDAYPIVMVKLNLTRF